MRGFGIALFAICFFAISWAMRGRLVDRMIFQPSAGADLLPDQLDLQGDEVYLDAEDGVRIHAFYLPAPRATRALIFLHGNAGNASHRLPNAAELVGLGCHVLLLDYRGYGLSDGRASESGVYADARAGLAYLIEKQGFPPNRVIVFGRSLGAAVAVDLAQDRELAGVILESAFSSAADIARSIGGSIYAAIAGDRFDSEKKIARLKAPLLFFHGDRDEIVEYSLGRRLFDAAPSPKTFETIEGAGHNNTVSMGGHAYFERIRQFLDEVAPEPMLDRVRE